MKADLLEIIEDIELEGRRCKRDRNQDSVSIATGIYNSLKKLENLFKAAGVKESAFGLVSRTAPEEVAFNLNGGRHYISTINLALGEPELSVWRKYRTKDMPECCPLSEIGITPTGKIPSAKTLTNGIFRHAAAQLLPKERGALRAAIEKSPGRKLQFT